MKAANPANAPGSAMWRELVSEAFTASRRSPALAGFYDRMVLRHFGFADALAEMLIDALAPAAGPSVNLREIVSGELVARVAGTAEEDFRASFDRNPAFPSLLSTLLYAKGLHALEAYRISHLLWLENYADLALFLHHLACLTYSVDIHPAAVIGTGVFIDHGTGIVVGETARIGDNVSVLHGVTLGGTGKESGDRHPKIGSGVLLGAHSTVLGNISIGNRAKIGSGSVVLHDVPEGVTMAGVPAIIVNRGSLLQPALSMDQGFDPKI